MAKKKPAKKPRVQARKKPRSQPLPGMEDRGIPALDQCGADYADIRDERMELTEREHALKNTVRVLMKKHNRTHYKNDAWEITLIPTEDDVKVKRVKPEDENADADDEPDGDDVDQSRFDEPPAVAEGEIIQTDERRQAVDADEDVH